MQETERLDLRQLVTNRSLKTMEHGVVVYKSLLTKTLIIPDITKTESSNICCFVIHVHFFEENDNKHTIAQNTV